MAVQYDLEGQKRVYERWAPFYDRVYDKLLSDAHRRTALAAAAAGPDILEVGVGTGLVLRYYPAHCRVVGVDLSEHMLRKAQEKAARLPQVSGLASMDACRLGFPDGRFDAVAVPFVITLTRPACGSHVKPTATTCGVPSGRRVVRVARWRSARNASTSSGRWRGSRAIRAG